MENFKNLRDGGDWLETISGPGMAAQLSSAHVNWWW